MSNKRKSCYEEIDEELKEQVLEGTPWTLGYLKRIALDHVRGQPGLLKVPEDTEFFELFKAFLPVWWTTVNESAQELEEQARKDHDEALRASMQSTSEAHNNGSGYEEDDYAFRLGKLLIRIRNEVPAINENEPTTETLETAFWTAWRFEIEDGNGKIPEEAPMFGLQPDWMDKPLMPEELRNRALKFLPHVFHHMKHMNLKEKELLVGWLDLGGCGYGHSGDSLGWWLGVIANLHPRAKEFFGRA